MLQFQKALSRRVRWDSSAEPMVLVPMYDDWLASYWAMEEAGTVTRADSVGSDDLPVHGSPGSATGEYGTCAYFPDGVAALVSAGVPSAVPNDTPMAVSGWFYSADWGVAIGAWCGLAGVGDQWLLSCDPTSDRVRFSVRDSGGVWTSTEGAVEVTGEWVHVVGVRSEQDTISVFANGRVVGTSAVSGSGWYATPTTLGVNVAPLAPETYKGKFKADELALWYDIPLFSTRSVEQFGRTLWNDGNGVFRDSGVWVEPIA